MHVVQKCVLVVYEPILPSTYYFFHHLLIVCDYIEYIRFVLFTFSPADEEDEDLSAICDDEWSEHVPQLDGTTDDKGGNSYLYIKRIYYCKFLIFRLVVILSELSMDLSTVKKQSINISSENSVDPESTGEVSVTTSTILSSVPPSLPTTTRSLLHTAPAVIPEIDNIDTVMEVDTHVDNIASFGEKTDLCQGLCEEERLVSAGVIYEDEPETPQPSPEQAELETTEQEDGSATENEMTKQENAITTETEVEKHPMNGVNTTVQITEDSINESDTGKQRIPSIVEQEDANTTRNGDQTPNDVLTGKQPCIDEAPNVGNDNSIRQLQKTIHNSLNTECCENQVQDNEEDDQEDDQEDDESGDHSQAEVCSDEDEPEQTTVMKRSKPHTVDKGATKDELFQLFDIADTNDAEHEIAGSNPQSSKVSPIVEEVPQNKPARRRVRTRGGVDPESNISTTTLKVLRPRHPPTVSEHISTEVSVNEGPPDDVTTEKVTPPMLTATWDIMFDVGTGKRAGARIDEKLPGLPQEQDGAPMESGDVAEHDVSMQMSRAKQTTVDKDASKDKLFDDNDASIRNKFHKPYIVRRRNSSGESHYSDEVHIDKLVTRTEDTSEEDETEHPTDDDVSDVSKDYAHNVELLNAATRHVDDNHRTDMLASLHSVNCELMDAQKENVPELDHVINAELSFIDNTGCDDVSLCRTAGQIEECMKPSIKDIKIYSKDILMHEGLKVIPSVKPKPPPRTASPNSPEVYATIIAPSRESKERSPSPELVTPFNYVPRTRGGYRKSHGVVPSYTVKHKAMLRETLGGDNLDISPKVTKRRDSIRLKIKKEQIEPDEENILPQEEYLDLRPPRQETVKRDTTKSHTASSKMNDMLSEIDVSDLRLPCDSLVHTGTSEFTDAGLPLLGDGREMPEDELYDFLLNINCSELVLSPKYVARSGTIPARGLEVSTAVPSGRGRKKESTVIKLPDQEKGAIMVSKIFSGVKDKDNYSSSEQCRTYVMSIDEHTSPKDKTVPINHADHAKALDDITIKSKKRGRPRKNKKIKALLDNDDEDVKQLKALLSAHNAVLGSEANMSDVCENQPNTSDAHVPEMNGIDSLYDCIAPTSHTNSTKTRVIEKKQKAPFFQKPQRSGTRLTRQSIHQHRYITPTENSNANESFMQSNEYSSTIIANTCASNVHSNEVATLPSIYDILSSVNDKVSLPTKNNSDSGDNIILPLSKADTAALDIPAAVRYDTSVTEKPTGQESVSAPVKDGQSKQNKYATDSPDKLPTPQETILMQDIESATTPLQLESRTPNRHTVREPAKSNESICTAMETDILFKSIQTITGKTHIATVNPMVSKTEIHNKDTSDKLNILSNIQPLLPQTEIREHGQLLKGQDACLYGAQRDFPIDALPEQQSVSVNDAYEDISEQSLPDKSLYHGECIREDAILEWGDQLIQKDKSMDNNQPDIIEAVSGNNRISNNSEENVSVNARCINSMAAIPILDKIANDSLYKGALISGTASMVTPIKEKTITFPIQQFPVNYPVSYKLVLPEISISPTACSNDTPLNARQMRALSRLSSSPGYTRAFKSVKGLDEQIEVDAPYVHKKFSGRNIVFPTKSLDLQQSSETPSTTANEQFFKKQADSPKKLPKKVTPMSPNTNIYTENTEKDGAHKTEKGQKSTCTSTSRDGSCTVVNE